MPLIDLKDAGKESVLEAGIVLGRFIDNLHEILDRLEIDVHIKLNKRKDETTDMAKP